MTVTTQPTLADKVLAEWAEEDAGAPVPMDSSARLSIAEDICGAYLDDPTRSHLVTLMASMRAVGLNAEAASEDQIAKMVVGMLVGF